MIGPVITPVVVRPFVLATIFLLLLLPAKDARAQLLDWAKTATGALHATGSGIAVDDAGNSYVTGLFNQTATFGPGEPNETTLTTLAIAVFVAKYDNQGALIWVRHAEPSYVFAFTEPPRIAIDAQGNSYVTGTFGRSIRFVGTAIEILNNQNQTDPNDRRPYWAAFLAKYDGGGNLVWARRVVPHFAPEAAITSSNRGGIAVGVDSTSYVVGLFEETFRDQNVLIVPGLFVAKYDANGELLWTTRADGPGWDPLGGSQDSRTELLMDGNGISIDSAGNAYIVGSFSGSLTFPSGEEVVSSGGLNRDLLLAKYDSHGAFLWSTQARGVGGGGRAYSGGISVDAAGYSHVTGQLTGAGTMFGAGEANETTITPILGDVYVAKYDPDGALVWARHAPGSRHDGGNGISVDTLGSVYLTGYFDNDITFGPGETHETTLHAPGSLGASGRGVFVAMYDGDGRIVWARQASGPGSISGGVTASNAVAVDRIGNSYVTGQFGCCPSIAASLVFGSGEPNETVLVSTGVFSPFVAKYRDSSHASSSTTLQVSSNVITLGEPLTLTAMVAAGVGIPTGTVEFFTGSTSLGAADLSGGVAERDVSLGVGVHTLSAVYAGDGSFLPSTSNTVQVEVVGSPPPPVEADLAIGTLTPVAIVIQRGDTVGYVVRVDNLGPAASTGSRVSVNKAAPVKFVGATGAACAAKGQSLECQLGAILSGGSAVFHISLQHGGPTGAMTVGFDVIGNEPDPDTANNSVSVTVPVIR